MNLPSVKSLNRAFPGKGKMLRLLLQSTESVNLHPAAGQAGTGLLPSSRTSLQAHGSS
jgi:hypothetical protein